MTIKIDNNTHWSTRDLRRFVTRTFREEEVNHKRTVWTIEVVYGRRNPRSGGWAFYNAPFMRIMVSSVSIDKEDFAATIAHELLHNMGVKKHSDFPPYLMFRGDWRKHFAWAKDLPLRRAEEYRQPKPKPDRDQVKLIHAMAMCKQWDSRIKRAGTLRKKWAKKVKYYETKMAAKRAPKGVKDDETNLR